MLVNLYNILQKTFINSSSAAVSMTTHAKAMDWLDKDSENTHNLKKKNKSGTTSALVSNKGVNVKFINIC